MDRRNLTIHGYYTPSWGQGLNGLCNRGLTCGWPGGAPSGRRRSTVGPRPEGSRLCSVSHVFQSLGAQATHTWQGNLGPQGCLRLLQVIFGVGNDEPLEDVRYRHLTLPDMHALPRSLQRGHASDRAHGRLDFFAQGAQ